MSGLQQVDDPAERFQPLIALVLLLEFTQLEQPRLGLVSECIHILRLGGGLLHIEAKLDVASQAQAFAAWLQPIVVIADSRRRVDHLGQANHRTAVV